MVRLASILLVIALLVAGCTAAAPVPAPSDGATITFTAPEELPPAIVGAAYSFSFATATSPSGGDPPYSFLLGSGIGFPPFGLTLDLNGRLAGTPTAAGTRTFEVCVKDLRGSQACETTLLTVAAAPGVWTGTFEIIGKEDQGSIGLNLVQDFRVVGDFTFTILEDDTIEGAGTARGEFTGVSGNGDRYETEASFTTSFSVAGYYYDDVESTIQFRDLSPADFTLTGMTYWKSGEVDGPYETSTFPVFYGFTFMAIGMEIADGASDEDTLGWGGIGEIRRTVLLSRDD